MLKQKFIISKIWEGKELCKDLGYASNKEGVKVAIEIYESKGYTVVTIDQINKLAMAYFDKEYPLDNKANDKTINRHSDAEYYFMHGVKLVIRHLMKQASGHSSIW